MAPNDVLCFHVLITVLIMFPSLIVFAIVRSMLYTASLLYCLDLSHLNIQNSQELSQLGLENSVSDKLSPLGNLGSHFDGRVVVS